MREIKFRAWDKEYEEMHYPTTNLFVDWDKHNGSKLLCELETEGGRRTLSDTEYEIMQYTGLFDKNGVLICEGDILKSFSSSVPSYEVFYNRGCFRLRYKLKDGEFYDWGPLYRMEEISQERESKMYPEVIGNIYQNPELLTPIT